MKRTKNNLTAALENYMREKETMPLHKEITLLKKMLKRTNPKFPNSYKKMCQQHLEKPCITPNLVLQPKESKTEKISLLTLRARKEMRKKEVFNKKNKENWKENEKKENYGRFKNI